MFVAAFIQAATVVAASVAFRRPMERVPSMDPLRTGDTASAQAIALVYEMPLDIDYHARPYRVKDGLCAFPEVSADGIEYTFRLKSGHHFTPDECFGKAADGTLRGRPVTARDMVYSLERLRDKANASSGMWTMANVDAIRALNDGVVTIRLKKPLHVFPWLMAMPYAAVVPHEAVEHYGIRFGGHAVGSGSYQLTQWVRNHQMTFTRNCAWPGWDGAPDAQHIFDAVEYYVIDDASTQWLMFLSGGADFLAGVSRDNWDAVVGKDGKLMPELIRQGITLHESASLSTFYIGINMRDPLLGGNRKLRQALNCAFDFPAWNRFLNGRTAMSDGPLPPGVSGKATTPFKYTFNLEKAKTLLAEAGYRDGIDPKTGRRLVLELTIGRASQSAREQAELLAGFYEKVGIRLEARYMTWDAYLKAVNDGRVSLYLLAWVADYPDAENFLQLFHSKNVSPGANHTNYVNPEFDHFYDAAMLEKDAVKRAALWQKAEEIVREDCPWIFLYYAKLHTLSRANVVGYQAGDFPYGEEKYLRYREGLGIRK